MGVWSRELARRAFEWQYSRGPERTTFFLQFFHSSFLSFGKSIVAFSIPVILVLVSLVYVCIYGEGERKRELYVYI